MTIYIFFFMFKLYSKLYNNIILVVQVKINTLLYLTRSVLLYTPNVYVGYPLFQYGNDYRDSFLLLLRVSITA